MQIKTGKGPISLIIVVALWSLSLAVDLPGLAVTPIEGSLRNIFTDTTDFKIQLLTVLPNLVIIPFVLLSGKLSETRHKISVIASGIVLYLAASILSIFSKSLTMLITLSCFLGAGCGLILPFSTGLIADVFTGKYRVKQMGIISAIGNIALVLATFLVGFLVAGDLSKTWHRAFFVYLIPLISLVLLPFLRKIPQQDYGIGNNTISSQIDSSPAGERADIPAMDDDGFSTNGQKVRHGFYVGRTIWLILGYFSFVFINIVPTYYLPNFKFISSEDASTMTSVLYLCMFAVGLALPFVLRILRHSTFIVAVAMMLIAFAIFVFIHNSIGAYVFAAGLCGLGNGITQPLFYTKATELVIDDRKSTIALSYLLVANYVAIALVPVVISAGEKIFNSYTPIFPFIFTGIATVALSLAVALRHKHFVFGISKKYYQ